MDVEAQCELIREFMVAIAPHVVAHSLESGSSMTGIAAITLEASMQLAARYNELHEALTAPAQNIPAQNKPQTGGSAAGVHKTQARIPVEKPEMPDVRSSGSGRPSPLSPDWRPPEYNR